MHITGLEAPEGLLMLGPFDFRCDERVNLFIGPNASGKSTILKTIEEVYSGECEMVVLDSDGDRVFVVVEFGGYFRIYLSWDWHIEADVEDMVSPDMFEIVPLPYIPVTRLNLTAPNRFQGNRTDGPLKALFDTRSGIFYGQHVQEAIDQLRQITTYDRSQQTQLRKALGVGYSCAKRICSEVISADIPSAYSDISGRERVVHYGMGIGTSDDIDEILDEPALYAGVLSSGTQGTLLWIYALVLKMASHYDWQEGWQEKPAILLIDEIENHLHPTWQRRVIPALLGHFPKLQIFATTHSPFVVAGRKAGQVHQLRRDEHGSVTATTNTEDIIGWTADEICRKFLDVVDPTDVATAEAAEELRKLRNEGPRSDEKEEEQRQLRIQELRQLVNRDLLAGGPAAAQRELFEQQFAEALEKYRQSQNLSQDNG